MCCSSRRLMTELTGFKPSAAKPSQKVAAPGPGEAGHVTYQLFYRPEQAKFSNNARVGVPLFKKYIGPEKHKFVVF